MGRGERISEAADRLAEPAALGGELAQPFLELGGHVVEGLAERGELVAAADGDALLELSASHGAGGGGQLAEGADDGAAERVRHDAHGGHGREGEEEEAAAEVARRGVDLGLGGQRDQSDRRAALGLLAGEELRPDRAVGDAVDRGVSRAVRDLGTAAEVGGRDDLVAGDEREAVAFLQRGVLCEPLRQLVAEGQVDDDPPEKASVGRDDLHLAHGGVRPGPLTGEELAFRGEEGAVRHFGRRLQERRAVALGEGALHLRRSGEGLGVVDGVVLELLPVVGRRDRDRSREARVGRADLAVDGHLGERHRRRHQRQQREKHEIDD